MSKYKYRCPLGTAQPIPVDKEEIKKDGWRDNGILVVAHDDPRLDWIERETIRRIGVRLYGEARCEA